MGGKGSKPKKSKKEVKAEVKTYKLLLLGTGESGKSAIFKQMKDIYGKKFSQEDLEHYRNVIHENVCEAMQLLCEGVKSLGFEADLQNSAELESFLASDRSSLNSQSTIEGKTVGDLVEILWKDPAVQKAWLKRSALQIVETHQIFLDEVNRLKQSGYLPSKEDIVYSRVRSSGVVTEKFEIEGKTFELYDVGGQRNERKKWIHVFDNVHAVIFVNALSEYDQVCFEDGTTNRMQESLTLFKSMAEHELFKSTGFILFLNKTDILKKKLGPHPINEVPDFSDYSGGEDFDKATQYFIKKFEDVSKVANPNRNLYIHLMCAADASNVKKVFDDCRAVLMDNAIKSSGAV
eukprot:c21369_g2_i5.p1 GENE.c21369_g2_i5~~c21369_g2_i5.p1  ORF type:complete len:348 (+),score=130.94 c21369_g2_i5:24-1067(+)